MTSLRPNFRVSSVLLLCGQRTFLSKRFGNGLYQSPGGKIEVGESPLDAAHRELFQETGLLISQDRFIKAGVLQIPEKSYEVHRWIVQLAPEEVPQQTEPHKATPWGKFHLHDVLSLPTVDALPGLVKMVLDAIERRRARETLQEAA